MPERARSPAAVATALLAALFVVLAAVRGEFLGLAGIVLFAAIAIAAILRRSRSGRDARRLGDEATGEGSDMVLASPDPVLAVDARAVVTAANAAAQQIIPGLRVQQPLTFALRAPEVLEAIRRVVGDGVPAIVEFGGRAATEAVYAVSLRPLRPPRPDGSVVALFFRDVSVERRLEAMRVDFVATVSHELRTPLASLAGFIDTLRGPARNDVAARERFLLIMREQADRMTRLVDDLLQLSRVELRAHLAPADPIDLGPLVGHMLEILAPLARDRSVVVSLSIEPGPMLVPGDRDELLRLVENLVENALKYGGGGGRVEVSLRRDPEARGIEFVVRDHGEGIAPEHLPRLTERFYRVDVVESRRQGGTGLGLAIVKHIVGRHRGRLTIQSEPGDGTRVHVWLPSYGADAGTGGVIKPSRDLHTEAVERP